MINLLKKLLKKKPSPVTAIGKTEVKPSAPKVDPVVKAEIPKVEKKDPVTSNQLKPNTPKKDTLANKKPGRPKGQAPKKDVNKSKQTKS